MAEEDSEKFNMWLVRWFSQRWRNQLVFQVSWRCVALAQYVLQRSSVGKQSKKVRCAFDLVIPVLKFFSLLELVELFIHRRVVIHFSQKFCCEKLPKQFWLIPTKILWKCSYFEKLLCAELEKVHDSVDLNLVFGENQKFLVLQKVFPRIKR